LRLIERQEQDDSVKAFYRSSLDQDILAQLETDIHRLSIEEESVSRGESIVQYVHGATVRNLAIEIV